MSEVRRRPIANSTNTQRRHKPDYWLVLLSIILLSVGLIIVYAISPGLSAQSNVSENYYVGKQLAAVGMGVAAFLVTANLPVVWWRRIEKPLLISAAVSAVAVRLIGQEVNGAYRWIQIGGLSFQAAELIKLALLVWLAGFLTDRIREGSLGDYKQTFKPLLIALAVIALVVAKVQSDLGSTGVMVMIMAAMVFIVGLPLKRVAIIGLVVLAGTALLVSSTAYRRQRFATFLHPASDCQSSGYQSCQALIAIGSGGIGGLGLAKGVQAYGYLPEAANDSIFAILAEKFGFLGVCALLGLFMAFFARLRTVIERAPDDYSRLLVVGVLAWLSTQVMINVGAMVGLLPLKGITLPFISYGGTSLVFILAAVGMTFQISRYTTYSGSVTNQPNERKTDDDFTGRRRFRGAYHPGTNSR